MELVTSTVRDASRGAAVATAGTLLAQGIVSASLPTIMSATGTVVTGVGTVHGTATAVAAAFAVAPILVPTAVIGAVVGVSIGLHSRL